MKNKGFTLIELLAVIVLLGVLLSITVISVNSIKKKQDEKNKLNIISGILTGAKEYNVDYKIDNDGVLVDTLKNKGYTDFDEEKFNANNLYVTKENCTGEFDLKYKYKITIDGKTYNDCGCDMQESGSISKTICEE